MSRRTRRVVEVSAFTIAVVAMLIVILTACGYDPEARDNEDEDRCASVSADAWCAVCW